MNIVIDLRPIIDFFNLPTDVMLQKFLVYYAWMPIALMFFWGGVMVWLYYRQTLYKKTIKFVLLAIDVPKGNDLSPKAIENMFSYLAGAHEPPDLIEKWWLGMFQLSFSFEIVSIEGYTQFLIFTPANYRDLLESAVYSQYPDAEITEVNDYTEGVPTHFPNEEYNVWGGEFIPAKPDIYPIKTYEQFENKIGKPETLFKDPLTVLLDMYSGFKKGEQFWYQIIVYPTGFDWPKKGDAEISKILKEKPKASNNVVDSLVTGSLGVLSGIADMITPTEATKKEEKKDEPLKMMNLKPKEKKQIEAIQEKISKVGFECKIRFAYVAKKDVFSKAKAIFGVIGFMKQFMDLDLNNLKVDMDMTATTAHYFFTDSRKNAKKSKIVSAYRDRTGTRGRKRFILNITELATLWHFPIEAVVRAPLIQRAPGKKAEPPMSLPVTEETSASEISSETGRPKELDSIFVETKKTELPLSDNISEKKQKITLEGADNIFERKVNDNPPEKKGSPPDNLPVV
jgi:hypothetical protein